MSSMDVYRSACQTYMSKRLGTKSKLSYSSEVTAHVMQTIETIHPDDVLDHKVFRVLGIGSGDGTCDIEILKAIATSLRSSCKENQKLFIHACIVEPNASSMEISKKKVSPLPEELAKLAKVSFEWRENTSQEFFDIYNSSQSESERYHIVHFISSLYYIDAEKSLLSCFSMLAAGGAIVCSVAGSQDFWLKQSRKFRGLISNSDNICIYTTDEVVAIAERNGWEYEELPKLHFQIDITSCFDKFSQTGCLLLDFLTHQINFRETADPSLHREFMDSLSEISTSDHSERKLVFEEVATVAIYK